MSTLEVILAVIVVLLAIRVGYLYRMANEFVELLEKYDTLSKRLVEKLKIANDDNKTLLAMLEEKPETDSRPSMN